MDPRRATKEKKNSFRPIYFNGQEYQKKKKKKKVLNFLFELSFICVRTPQNSELHVCPFLIVRSPPDRCKMYCYFI